MFTYEKEVKSNKIIISDCEEKIQSLKNNLDSAYKYWNFFVQNFLFYLNKNIFCFYVF